MHNDKYLHLAPHINTLIRKRAGVDAAAAEGWTGDNLITAAQLDAAVNAFINPGQGLPAYGVGTRVATVRARVRATMKEVLANPDASPFVDNVAVERAVNFDQAALRSLTPLEWDVFGGVMHTMGDTAFGDRWDGDRSTMEGEFRKFSRVATVDETRCARRRAFLSLPEDLEAQVREVSLRAKHRIGNKKNRPTAVAA